MLHRFVFVVVAILLVAAGVSHAEDPVADAQAAISSQISAFLAGDKLAAFAQAGPNLRNGITDEDAFLRMIRDRYPAVYHAQRHAFGRSKMIGGGELILQEVIITDRGGRDWTALFEVRLMNEGGYRINGVRLARNVASQGI